MDGNHVAHQQEKQELPVKASFIRPKRYIFFESSIAVMHVLSNNIIVLA